MKTPRAHQRYPVKLSAEVQWDGRAFTATTRNLSLGGCCLEAAYPLPEGVVLHLLLFLVVEGVEDAHAPPLAARATVQWVAETDANEYAAGVKFSGISHDQAAWLERFLTTTNHK